MNILSLSLYTQTYGIFSIFISYCSLDCEIIFSSMSNIHCRNCQQSRNEFLSCTLAPAPFALHVGNQNKTKESNNEIEGKKMILKKPRHQCSPLVFWDICIYPFCSLLLMDALRSGKNYY